MDSTKDWPGVLGELRSLNFESSIEEHGYCVLETLEPPDDVYEIYAERCRESDQKRYDAWKDYMATRKQKPESAHIKQPRHSTDYAFAALVLGAPNGVVLIVNVNFDGNNVEGVPIPKEVRKWLTDPCVFKMGFHMMDTTLVRLRYSSLNIQVTNVVTFENWAMVCFPTIHQVMSRNYLAKMHGVSVRNRFRSNDDGLGFFLQHERIFRTNQAGFHKDYLEWAMPLKVYARYVALLPMAFLDKSVARLVELDNMSRSTNIVPMQHMILAWLSGFKVREQFEDVESGAGGRGRLQFPDWMTSDFSPNPYDKSVYQNLPWPLHFTRMTFAEWPNVFVRMSTMRRRHMVDVNAVSSEVLELVQSFSLGQRLDQVDATHHLSKWCANAAPMGGARNFPHYCAKCGSFDHAFDECQTLLLPASQCGYPLCENRNQHTTMVCPKLNTFVLNVVYQDTTPLITRRPACSGSGPT